MKTIKQWWCGVKTGHWGTLDESGAWFTCDGCGKGVEL